MEWISVDDRLPEYKVNQLQDSNVDVLVFPSRSIEEFGMLHSKICFFSWDGYWDRDIEKDNVTHWMPLPDPPTTDK